MGVWQGKEIEAFSNKDVFSLSKHNEVLEAVNTLLNIHVDESGTKAGIKYSDKKVRLNIPRQRTDAVGTGASAAHPFKLYRVPDSQLPDADKGKICYAVRSGLVELRSKWKDQLGSGGETNVSNRGNHSFWFDSAGGVLGDDVELTDSALGVLGTDGTYFALDDISGIDNEGSGGVTTYGCYYSFWIEIADFTPNTRPVCTIKCRRFGWEGGIYTAVAFDGPTDMEGKGVGVAAPILFGDYEAGVEIIPVAILQLKAGNGSATPPAGGIIKGNMGIGVTGTGVDNVEPAIMQIQRDHLVNRFTPAGLTFRFVGEYNPRQYRTYYYGDTVFYGAGGDNTNAFYGMWIQLGTYHMNGAAETNPPIAGGWSYFGNVNPPSVTNPP